jgi:hypothetical protein
VELLDALKRREREGTKHVKESFNQKGKLRRRSSLKAVAHLASE